MSQSNLKVNLEDATFLQGLERQLPTAFRMASASGRNIRSCLAELWQLSERDCTAVLATIFGYAEIVNSELHSLAADFSVLQFNECRDRNIFCGRDSDGCQNLVLSDPFDAEAEDWAMRKIERKIEERIKVRLANPADAQDYLTIQEGRRSAFDDYDERFQTDNGRDEDVPIISLTSIGEESSEIVRLVNSTIYDALKIKASDIHLECDDGGLHVQFRVDGVLVPIATISGVGRAEQIVSRVKIMGELDIAERRIPQDGRFRVRIERREVDFRVSIMPNAFGEDAVLRLLDRQSLTDEQAGKLTLEYLGLNAESMTLIRELSRRPHGMLLVTGPTGSGKTTTLYAAITEIHTGRDKIVTIEDPVEYRLPRVLQIPVNEKKGLTFARGLRSILRHDPDKIMVGEIRDDETAQIAVQAALTGHLVFTTVHANNVFDVLGRFLHMGVDAHSFAAALNGIVSQRLLRLNCQECSKPYLPAEDILHSARLSANDIRGWTFKSGIGCVACRSTGFRGRKAIAEVLVLDDALRDAIAARASGTILRERAAKNGMKDMRGSALELVQRGDTTLEEFLRVAG